MLRKPSLLFSISNFFVYGCAPKNSYEADVKTGEEPNSMGGWGASGTQPNHCSVHLLPLRTKKPTDLVLKLLCI